MTAQARLGCVAGDDVSIAVEFPAGFTTGREFAIELRRRNGALVATPTVTVVGDTATITVPAATTATWAAGWLHGHFAVTSPDQRTLFRLDLLVEADLTGGSGPASLSPWESSTSTVNVTVDEVTIPITTYIVSGGAVGGGVHTHVAVDVTDLGNSATRNVGTAAGTVAAGNDARLSDARTPLAHTHPAADVSGLGDAAMKSVGTTTGTVAAGDHTHDAAAITSGIIAPARLGSGAPSSSLFLRGDGAWATPSGGGGGAPVGDLRPVWPTVQDGIGIFLNGNNSPPSLTSATAVGLTLLKACTVTAIAIYVGTGGSADARVGIAVYAAGSDGRPGALIADCGTVPTASAGAKTLTLGSPLSLSAGPVFIATVCAAGTTTPANLYGLAPGTSGTSIGFRGGVSDNVQRGGTYYFTTAAGAFAASPSWLMSSLCSAVVANFALTIGSVS